MTLSIREIAPWREHAPWTTDAQVEQDLLLTRAMIAIFSDQILSPLVAMRGGTALHKVHLAPAARYSEDIDLVLVGDVTPAFLEREIRRVLAPPMSTFRKGMTLRARNAFSKSKIIELEYPFRTTVGDRPAFIKIEANCNERTPLYAIENLSYDPPAGAGHAAPVTLRTYDFDEMLGTKLRALHQRDQGRDLFDAWWTLFGHVTGPHRPDPRRVIDAFDDYMAREKAPVGADAYRQALERKLANPDFTADMAGMLRGDAPPFDFRKAADLVIGTLVPLMAGGRPATPVDDVEAAPTGPSKPG